jgi:hypothetical protein
VFALQKALRQEAAEAPPAPDLHGPHENASLRAPVRNRSGADPTQTPSRKTRGKRCTMRFSIYQESLIGGRKVNQDRMGYCYTRDALLMLLADGMGGHIQGEAAATDRACRPCRRCSRKWPRRM